MQTDDDDLEFIAAPHAGALRAARDDLDEALTQLEHARQRTMWWEMRAGDLERSVANLRSVVLGEIEEATR